MHFEWGQIVGKWFGLFLFVLSSLLGAPAGAQSQSGAQSPSGAQSQTQRNKVRPPEEVERREQPGATQGAVTTSEPDANPKPNRDYFVREWKFSGSVSESPLGAGGPMSGSEVVRNVWDGKFWDITIKGEAPEGPFTGKGVIVYQDTFAGQSSMRYEVTRGIALLRSGIVGCDLGQTCNVHFETPPFQHNGSRIQLKGRYYLTSPFSYRLTTEISVNRGPFRNLGTLLYSKNEKVKPEPIK